MAGFLAPERIAAIDSLYLGRLFCFTAVPALEWFGLGIVEANISGFTPVPVGYFKAGTFDQAQKEADRLNTDHLKLDKAFAWKIVNSASQKTIPDIRDGKRRPYLSPDLSGNRKYRFSPSFADSYL